MYKQPVITMRKSYSSIGQQTKEQKLISEIATGNEKALEQLYQTYYARLYQFIFHITRRQDCIAEIINDVMFVVWEKAATYNQSCRPSTWILGIAYLKSLKCAEQNRVREEQLVELNDETDNLPCSDMQWMAQLEIDNWLEVAFNKLSTEHRAVIEMTYYQGLHYKEISEIMRCPENTVKTRMFHARKILATLLPELSGKR